MLPAFLPAAGRRDCRWRFPPSAGGGIESGARICRQRLLARVPLRRRLRGRSRRREAEPVGLPRIVSVKKGIFLTPFENGAILQRLQAVFERVAESKTSRGAAGVQVRPRLLRSKRCEPPRGALSVARGFPAD